jgi:hypothetical protein
MNKFKILLQLISVIPWPIFLKNIDSSLYFSLFFLQVFSFLTWMILEKKTK